MILLVVGFYFVNPYLGVISTFSFIAFFLMILFMFKPLVYASAEHTEADNVISGKMNDSLQNIFHIKSFGREIFEGAYLRKYFKQERSTNKKFLLLSEYVKLMTSITNIIIMGVIFLIVQIELFRRGLINVADVAYCFMSMTNYFFAMWSLGYEMPYIIDEYGICKQSLVVLQQEHTIKDVPTKDILVKEGLVEFRNIFFGYNNKILFSNLNLTIKPKQKIGLVGRSGGGKTSLTNLLMRYFDPISGEILIDNQNIKNHSLESLHNAISVVPQDTMLFDRTILENLRYSNPIASFSQVVEAAKKAQAHSFIVEMVNGYDAVVSERGKKMSGGQRQRIAIARAFLKDSPVLILDEVTSALDSETELSLMPILNELMKNKTVFSIAHRLHTLVNMDKILVFDEGVIVESGTHEELLAIHDGFYAKMWNSGSNN
jgi:ATP-binding cassette subfamily B protein